MVHAEASNFLSGLSKKDVYAQVIKETKALCDGQRNWVWSGCTTLPSDLILTMCDSNLANTASLLWHALHSLPAPSNRVNWAGFYVLDPRKESQLILGPFQGKVACQTIAFGRGVCGAAAASALTQLVPDVANFTGHIACDGDSESEIVVPILSNGQVVAIIDIDCAVKNGFNEQDQTSLEELADVLSSACDWYTGNDDAAAESAHSFA